MTTNTADPINILRNKDGRGIDVSLIITEMKALQSREHWRDNHVRITVEAWRRRIVQDTGSTSAPIAFAKRLAGHIDAQFQRHLLLDLDEDHGQGEEGAKS